MDKKKIDVSDLARAWLHSHEEDTPTTTVFRPVTFAFPPSRGRKGFHLAPDGTLSTRQPGPTDQTVTAAGTWKLAGDQLDLAPDGEAPRSLAIETVEPDKLVVKKKPS